MMTWGKDPPKSKERSTPHKKHSTALSVEFKKAVEDYGEGLVASDGAYGLKLVDGRIEPIVDGMELLVKIATAAGPRRVKNIFLGRSRDRWHILLDFRGRVRLALLANALKRAMDGDPAWSKHVLDIIKENRAMFMKMVKDNEIDDLNKKREAGDQEIRDDGAGRLGTDKKDRDGGGEKPDQTVELKELADLLRMDGDGEGSEGGGGSGEGEEVSS